MADRFDLFERCKNGDAQAQRILYDLFKGKLMGLCRRYTRSHEEAQDVLQETFIRVFSKMGQLTAPEKLESWMKTIAVNTAINHYRKTKVENVIFSKIPDDKEETKVSADIADHVSDGHLVTLINQLPDGCRVIFNLFVVEGYSHVEIAQMLEISEGTSRSQLHHAKQLLKSKLKCHDLAHYYEKFA
jgi:RNA polymerase sigma factor (sigma-70 family)